NPSLNDGMDPAPSAKPSIKVQRLWSARREWISQSERPCGPDPRVAIAPARRRTLVGITGRVQPSVEAWAPAICLQVTEFPRVPKRSGTQTRLGDISHSVTIDGSIPFRTVLYCAGSGAWSLNQQVSAMKFPELKPRRKYSVGNPPDPLQKAPRPP